MIEVEYEELDAVFDIDETMEGTVVIHPEADKTGIADPAHNIAARLDASVGNLEAGLAEADVVLEQTYHVQAAQHCHIEPHIAAAWLDEDNRLVIRTARLYLGRLGRDVPEGMDRSMAYGFLRELYLFLREMRARLAA